MLPSAFNLRVPLTSGDVFVTNTLADAQIVVSPSVEALLNRGTLASEPGADMPEALAPLAEQGFMVTDCRAEMSSLESFFASFRVDASDIRVTVLTTFRCNLACDYCYQGEPTQTARSAERMSMATAGRAGAWIEAELRRMRPSRLVLTFFGGEPLLNVSALFEVAERTWRVTQDAGIPQAITLITNGVLLTPEIVTRLLPLGLCGVKVTLDGDREIHDRLRPLRGGQGTFDHIINSMRRVAPLVPLTVGGNFDMSTAERYPALLDFLREQGFADRIAQISFKPIIRPAGTAGPPGVIPLTAVGESRTPPEPSCSATAGGRTGVNGAGS
ncbi:MAG: radical SAM protein, partial [Actinomycetes bacterium]